jgi:hypothetical protein
MTTPGTGGLPQRRPDQQRTYSAPTAAPGASAGIIRARIVEIIGGSGSGVFVYSGSPALGDLIASLVGATTADPFGNPVDENGLTVYGSNGQSAFLGVAGTLGQLIFRSGASFEGAAANVSASPVGSGGSEIMELVLSGPKGNAGAGTDWAQIIMASSPESGFEAAAAGQLIYVNAAGDSAVSLQWGSNGVEAPEINGMALAGPQGDPGAADPDSDGVLGGASGTWETAAEERLNNILNILNNHEGVINGIRAALIDGGVMS